MSNDNTMNRRQALGGIGAVLVTTIINPVSAAGIDSSSRLFDVEEDSTAKFIIVKLNP